MPSIFQQHDGNTRADFPLWLKIAYTLFVALIVVVYWFAYGPQNYLWFSDITLILLVPALWLRHSLIVSMMAIGVLPFEIYWFLDFISGARLGGMTGYMFDETGYPVYLRALSLFHLVLPPLLITALWRFGYDRRAWLCQTLLSWVVLPMSYFLTDPKENINWVFGPGFHQETIHPLLYLGLYMALQPLIVYAPLHFIMRRIVGDKNKKKWLLEQDSNLRPID